MDNCETSLNWGGYLIDWVGHSYVTNCKDQTNHRQVRDIFKSLISLNRVNINRLISLNRVTTNQNGGFLSFWGKIALENLLIFKKEA